VCVCVYLPPPSSLAGQTDPGLLIKAALAERTEGGGNVCVGEVASLP